MTTKSLCVETLKKFPYPQNNVVLQRITKNLAEIKIELDPCAVILFKQGRLGENKLYFIIYSLYHI